MANNSKISGNISGNKLNISISTNSSDSAQKSSGIQSIQSTGKKVQSIADVQKNAQQQNDLNKKAVVQQKKTQSVSQLKELQLLKNINDKLASLNQNVVKIQNIRNTDQKKQPNNVKQPDKNIFSNNFIEGMNKSILGLLDNSSFKSKLNTVLTDIYDDSTLLKTTDLTQFKQQVSELIQKSSYTIQDSQKAVNQQQNISDNQSAVKTINDAAKQSNDGLQTQNIEMIKEAAESIKQAAENKDATASLQTNTNDQTQNQLNQQLIQISKKLQIENQKKQQDTANLDKQVQTNNEDKAVNEQQKSDLDKIAQQNKSQVDTEKVQGQDQKINQTVLQKIDTLNQKLQQNVDSLNQLINDRKLMKQTKKTMMQQRKKQMVNKTNKSKSFSSMIKGAISSTIAPIRKIGSSLSFGKIGSTIKQTFNRQPIQKKSSRPVTSTQLLRQQKTMTGKDSNSPLRDLQKTSSNFLMTQSAKKVGTTTEGSSNKSAIGQLTKIGMILEGFSIFYKRMALQSRQREIYKLRFGQQQKKDDGLWAKLLNALKFKKSKKVKSSGTSAVKDLGWIGMLLGLVWGGLKFFGKTIGKLALKGIWGLTKLIGKGLWALGKLAFKGIWWCITKIGPLIGKVLVPLLKGLASLTGKVFGALMKVLGPLGMKVFGAFSKVFGGIFGKVANLIAPIFGKLAGVFKGVFGKVFGKISSIISKLLGPLLSKIPGIGKLFGGRGGGGGGDMLDSVTDMLPGRGKKGKIFRKGKAIFKKFSRKGGKIFKSVGKLFGKGGGGFLKSATGIFKGGAGKGIAKVGSKLLGKGALKLGLKAGAGALKAIPGVGLVAGAAMAAFDAVDGWKNAASITGKKQKDLTWKDRSKAAGASVLSGLTFGLVSSKTMYKGINAVTGGISKANQWMNKKLKSGLSIAGKGIGKAFNWLTKPQVTKDKDGKVVQGKTGLQKIGDIGKTLFKMTPLGMGLSAAKSIAGTIFGKKDKGIEAKQFSQMKSSLDKISQYSRMSALMAAKQSNMTGFLKSLEEKNNKGLKSILQKNSATTNNTLKVLSTSMAGTKSSVSLISKMNTIQNNKIQAAAKHKQNVLKHKDDAKKHLQMMPQIIRLGIAGYFDKNTLQIDQKTGKIKVLPLGVPDKASKI